MNDETKEILKSILKSCETMASNGAKRSIKKTADTFARAEKDINEYKAWQAQQQQHNWTALYIQTTAPRLADIMSAVLSSVLKSDY